MNSQILGFMANFSITKHLFFVYFQSFVIAKIVLIQLVIVCLLEKIIFSFILLQDFQRNILSQITCHDN